MYEHPVFFLDVRLIESFSSENHPVAFDHISKSTASPESDVQGLPWSSSLVVYLIPFPATVLLNIPFNHTDLLVVLVPRFVLFQPLTSLRLLLYVTTSEKSSLILLHKIKTHSAQFIFLVSCIFHNTSSDVYHHTNIIHFTCLYPWRVVFVNRILYRQWIWWMGEWGFGSISEFIFKE